VTFESTAKRRLRILHVSPSYAPMIGGAERLLQSVSERLVERGHAVIVLTFDCATQRDFWTGRPAGLPPRETLNGVRIVRVGTAPGGLHQAYEWWLRRRGGWRTAGWLVGMDDWALLGPSGINMLRSIATSRADVVTSVNWCIAATYWAVLPRALRRAPRVGVPILHIERDWASNPHYLRMFEGCDASIVCTDAEREFVEARGGRSVAVAGAGADPSRFATRDGARIRAQYGIGDRPVVGFVGRQDELKGAATLIDAMRIVWNEFPAAVLLMAGPSAHRDTVVSERLAALSDCDRSKVVLIDDFADIDGPSIMDACEVLALPSVEESFGMVFVEAWMCGKPVIGGDIASTRCVIDRGVDGWTATPFDAPDLALKIVDLLADPAKRAGFGERGRAKALARYTWERVTDVWETTLINAVEGASGRRASPAP
jgi:glycosyltransferase involved in cell wall biosynthesis